MAETRKIAAILAADVVGFSRMTSADEDGTLAQLRALRGDLFDPMVAAQNGRVFKRTGDGALVEFRSVVEAVKCAIAVQNAMAKRYSSIPLERRIVFRIGIHLGDVVEESDGDIMGDGVNIAARLEAIAEPGAICLSEDAYRHVKARLDLAVTDLGPQQLKNIAEPIRAYLLDVGRPAQAKSMVPSAPQSSAPPRLSLVVLPFVNIGGGEEYEYFADGVTESLTTDLSRIPGAIVIARNTAFTYKGNSVDVKAVGRELNVRYALEGSVQRGGNRMRVNVQFIDAGTGSHLWAERFDKPIADLFDMQDEIVARLASTLNVELITAEARRAERNPNPDSMDLQLQALAWLNKGHSLENRERTRDLCAQALALDPDNIEALVTSAFADVVHASRRAHPAISGSRKEVKASAALGSELCGCSLGPGLCLHLHRAGFAGDRRKRTRSCAK
jgi:adenylate cyclase